MTEWGNISTPEEASYEVTKTLTPLLVLLSIYILVGILGNPFVVIFYGCKLKQTPSFIFIIALAVFDLIVCCVSIPMEILDVVRFYTFPSSSACKLLRFVNYFATVTSGLFLLAIAADRFRKICKPLQKQLTNHMAKIVVFVNIGIGLFLTWPSFVFYTVTEVNITIAGNGTVGNDCAASTDPGMQMFVLIYHGILFLVFIISMTALTVIYILVARQLIITQKRFRANADNADIHQNHPESPKVEKNMSSESSLSSKNESDLETNGQTSTGQIKESPLTMMSTSGLNGGKANSKTSDKKSVKLKDVNTESDSPKIFSQRGHTKSYRKRKKEAFNLHTRKYTFISIAISVGFVVSFLPYLILYIWLILSGIDVLADLSKAEFVLMEIGIRSWILNSIVNPFIYGFFNTKFRLFIVNAFRAIFCCFYCRKSPASDYGINDHTWASFSGSTKTHH